MVEAIITHNIVPLLREPRSGSEQISQSVLGESVLLLERQNTFSRIQTEDGYEGWCWSHHLRPYHRSSQESEVAWGSNLEQGIWHHVVIPIAPMRHRPHPNSGIITQLVFGTFVAARSAQETPEAFIRVEIPDSRNREDLFQSGYVDANALVRCDGYPAFNGETACEIAQMFLGTPYLWGGGTPFGFDCSGFVHRIYRYFGIVLPRDAYQQVESPLLEPIPNGASFQAGDLLFFGSELDPEQRGITHVGMALNTELFVHASSKEGVTVTPMLDSYYQQVYRTARRFH